MTTSPAMSGRRRAFGDTIVLFAVILIGWQLTAHYVGAVALSSPATTLRNLFSLLAERDFWSNVEATFTAFGIALVVEIILGIVLGLLMGLHRLSGEVIEPILVTFYSVPKIVFFPVVLMFCGIGLAAEVVFGVMHGILPTALFTQAGVQNIKPVYFKTARVMGLTRWQVICSIALPAALPELFSGIRIGFSATLLGVLVSEMFGSRSGLGSLLMKAIGVHDVEAITALTVIFIAFATAANAMMLAVDRWLQRQA